MARTRSCRSSATMSIGKRMPKVCTPDEGWISSPQSASSPFRPKRPTRRVRNVSATEILVATTAPFVRFTIVISFIERKFVARFLTRYARWRCKPEQRHFERSEEPRQELRQRMAHGHFTARWASLLLTPLEEWPWRASYADFFFRRMMSTARTTINKTPATTRTTIDVSIAYSPFFAVSELCSPER